MANLRIAYKNLADTATLTASPVALAAGPVTHLQLDARGYTFQAGAAGAQEIKGTWSTAQTLACCILYRHNLATNDTWRLQLYSDTAWTTQIYDSGTVDAFVDGIFDEWDYGFSALYFAQVTTAKSFKITVTSAASLTADRLFLGPYVEATFNPKYGAALGWASNSAQTRSRGGSLRVATGSQWRELKLDMFVATEADRATWMEIGRYVDTVLPVWVSVFPGEGTARERDYAMLAKFADNPTHKLVHYNTYDHTLTLVEL